MTGKKVITHPLAHGDLVVSASDLKPVLDAARSNTLRRSRICAHQSDDAAIHEMLICFDRETYVQPHRHRSKRESFHVISGEIEVIYFDDLGSVLRRIRMGTFDSGLPFFLRNETNDWHTVIIHTDSAIIHETTNGPFNSEESEFAPWSAKPSESSAVLSFLGEFHD